MTTTSNHSDFQHSCFSLIPIRNFIASHLKVLDIAQLSRVSRIFADLLKPIEKSFFSAPIRMQLQSTRVLRQSFEFQIFFKGQSKFINGNIINKQIIKLSKDHIHSLDLDHNLSHWEINMSMNLAKYALRECKNIHSLTLQTNAVTPGDFSLLLSNNIQSLDLRDRNFDNQLSIIPKKCRNLTHLSLNTSTIDNNLLKNFAENLKKLNSFTYDDVSRTVPLGTYKRNIEDGIIALIKSRAMVNLNLSHIGSLSNKVMIELTKNAGSLEKLIIPSQAFYKKSDSEATEEEIKMAEKTLTALLENCSKLKTLKIINALSNRKNITENWIKRIIKLLDGSLENLELNHYHLITDSTLCFLKNHLKNRKLKKLISSSFYPDYTIDGIKSIIPHVEYLVMGLRMSYEDLILLKEFAKKNSCLLNSYHEDHDKNCKIPKYLK